MPLTYLEEMQLTLAFQDALRLKLTDKSDDILPPEGTLYQTIDPSAQSLLGSLGGAPDPTYAGPPTPSAMGIVLMVAPDAAGFVKCCLSGQFDVVHREIPDLAFMRESLIAEASGLKAKQQIAIAYRRFTIQFEDVLLSLNCENAGEWVSDEERVQKRIAAHEQQCLLDPRIFRKCNVNDRGNAQFYFDWADALVVSQEVLNSTITSALFSDTSRVAPYRVRLRGRLRRLPPSFEETHNRFLLELYLENLSSSEEMKPFGFDRPILLDVRFTAQLVTGEHFKVPHRLRPEDYRYVAEDGLPGYGITCGLKQVDQNSFATDSLPRVAQPRVEAPRPEDVGMASFPPHYASLAADPLPVLQAFLVALREYRDIWAREIALIDSSKTDSILEAQADRAKFDRELTRIEDGVTLLQASPDLLQCFRWMNESMQKAIALQKKSFKGWHLFQLGFILTQMRAIYERHTDAESATPDADTADVLWFATGGGKTEAYLGIVALMMLYGRVKGRLYGCNAWMRFPLRMLSVQQFQRLSYVVAQANILRQRENLGGHPFTIGYYTGGGTPGRISSNSEFYKKTFLPELSTERLAEYQFITDCPYCGTVKGITLARDYASSRLKHVCRNDACWSNQTAGAGTHGESIKGEIGIYVSDEECYRYLPTVMVGTIDKLAVIAFNHRFAGFFGAFRHFCPEHGFTPEAKCAHNRIVQKLDGEFDSVACGNNSRTSVLRTKLLDPMKDKGFAFLIQDELHLLRESLGNFDAHYETTLAAIQIASGGRTPKVLAATATIKDLEDHIHHLYMKQACSFPALGATRGESFYARRSYDRDTGTPLVRRWFSGILPISRGSNVTIRTVAEISSRFLDQVDAWRLALAAGESGLLAQLGLPVERAGEALTYIEKNLNTDLIYANMKRSITEVQRFLEEGNARRGVVRDYKQLDGDTSLENIMAAIRHVEGKHPDDTSRHVIATNVVSHGIDIAELNFMVFAGWPSSTSEYIQASARSGRVHPGVVIAVLSASKLFENNIFLNFQDYHFFLEKLVDSVPINRFAPNLLDRTLPGILAAILINLAPHSDAWGKDLDKNVKSVYKVLNADGKARQAIERWVLQALSVPTAMHVDFDPRILQDFHKALSKSVSAALHRLEHWSAGRMDESISEAMTGIFGHKPLQSFRDIEEQIQIKAVNEQAERIIDALSR